MKIEKTYIDRILYSIAKIESFVKDVDKEMFLSNTMMQPAIIMHLVAIGENANKISGETKEKIDLPWREIVGFRNIAIHEYSKLALDTVWDTVQNNIPELKAKLEIYYNDSNH
jgi:uncharacterized protein with HEPN domain